MVRSIGKKVLVVAGAYVAARVARALLFRYQDDIVALMERGLNSLDIDERDFADVYEHLEDAISLRVSQEDLNNIEQILKDFSTNFSNPDRK